MGTALLEVSQPRVPCFKLGDPDGRRRLPRPFLAAAAPGFYLRVLEEGDVAAGDAIEREARGEGGMSVRTAGAAASSDGGDPEAFSTGPPPLPALEVGWKVFARARAIALRRRAR